MTPRDLFTEYIRIITNNREYRTPSFGEKSSSRKIRKVEKFEKSSENSRNETEKVKSTSLQKPTEYRKEIRHEFNQQRGVYPEEVNR